MSRIARAAVASLGLVVLVGGLGLPLLGFVLADEPVPFCCTKGRCCCADATGAGERPCLRRGCGCSRPDAVVAGAPLRVEAVLPALTSLAPGEARRFDRCVTTPSPLDRSHEPPLPPPKRRLPA